MFWADMMLGWCVDDLPVDVIDMLLLWCLNWCSNDRVGMIWWLGWLGNVGLMWQRLADYIILGWYHYCWADASMIGLMIYTMNGLMRQERGWCGNNWAVAVLTGLIWYYIWADAATTEPLLWWMGVTISGLMHWGMGRCNDVRKNETMSGLRNWWSCWRCDHIIHNGMRKESFMYE